MAEPVLKRIAHGDSRAVAQCIAEFGGLVWVVSGREHIVTLAKAAAG